MDGWLLDSLLINQWLVNLQPEFDTICVHFYYYYYVVVIIIIIIIGIGYG